MIFGTYKYIDLSPLTLMINNTSDYTETPTDTIRKTLVCLSTARSTADFRGIINVRAENDVDSCLFS